MVQIMYLCMVQIWFFCVVQIMYFCMVQNMYFRVVQNMYFCFVQIVAKRMYKKHRRGIRNAAPRCWISHAPPVVSWAICDFMLKTRYRFLFWPEDGHQSGAAESKTPRTGAKRSSQPHKIRPQTPNRSFLFELDDKVVGVVTSS